jgi:hypothetical protein
MGFISAEMVYLDMHFVMRVSSATELTLSVLLKIKKK